VFGVVALAWVWVEDHRSFGQELASKLDLPLDGEHRFRTRLAAAGKAGKQDSRDAEYSRTASSLRDLTHHVFPLG
jgi:hypothetical protein